jgi:lipid II:glycine glycyltransferase (peptidoglycan interpeptide bridge formation enzyme)
MATVLLRGLGPTRRGYVPRGPVPPSPDSIEDLLEWGGRLRLASLRIEPEAPPELASDLERLGLRPAAPTQPTRTEIVTLRSETELLSGFQKKTRYSIRRSGPLEVEEGLDADALARQTAATASRKDIALPDAAYYRLLLEKLAWSRTYVAKLHGEALAANLVARFDGRAYYLYAGWGRTHPELMPAYGAIWAALQAAARDSCADFDLWGVPPEVDRDHPWHSIWVFKRGFGGRSVGYCGAWELVYAPVSHAVSRFAESVRLGIRRARRVRAR